MIIKSFKIQDDTNKYSRYRSSRRFLDDTGHQFVETYDSKKIPESSEDTYHIVTLKDTNRLDLISFQYYRTPLLWWVIAEASNITDPFNVPVNSVVRVPKLHSVYGYGGVLS